MMRWFPSFVATALLPGVLLGAVLGLGACRGPRLVGQEQPLDPQEPTAPETRRIEASAVPVAGNAVARVEPGRYRTDVRFGRLADRWPEHVAEAVTLLNVRTGLGFQGGPPVRVALEPLRDESLSHRIATRVARGRRQAVVTVNAEPLVAQTARVDTTLVRALAEAVFELVALRHDPVPPWVVSFAGTAAADDVALQVARMHREAILADTRGPGVDPTVAEAALPTGVALLALLEDRDRLDDVPKLLAFAAQGDDPEWMLTRILREANASWVGPARSALVSRMGDLDRTPWERLRAAQVALETTGRGGLEAALAPPLPEVIEGEAKVLRIRAAMAEGDWSAARRFANALTATEARQLRDPAGFLALRTEIASRPDGDGVLSRECMRRLELDFPRSIARTALRESYPLLGSGEDPLGWLTQMRAYIDRRGTERLDLRTLERVLRVLLFDHRPGAAAGLIDSLAERAEAPELEAVIGLVNEAQADPTPAAVETNRARLERWIADPGEETLEDIRDGGRAAWRPALTQLDHAGPEQRRRLIQLLVALGGPTDTLRALAPAWAQSPPQAGLDIDAIAQRVDARVLRRVLRMLAPSVLPHEAVTRLWFDASFGLDAAWLDGHPDFLQRLGATTYMERRAALDQAVQDGVATPELVGRGARDVSALLRAEAMRVAGVEGFVALALTGLGDASPLVRGTAARALAAANAERAPDALLKLLTSDPVADVRIAAARALLEVRPRDAAVLDALVATQATARKAVRDAVAAILVTGPPAAVSFALVRAARAELAEAQMRTGVFARYVLVFQRVSGENLRFVPGLSRPEQAAIVARMQTWAQRTARRAAVVAGPADSADDRLR